MISNETICLWPRTFNSNFTVIPENNAFLSGTTHDERKKLFISRWLILAKNALPEHGNANGSEPCQQASLFLERYRL
jgi:hypothetical protein